MDIYVLTPQKTVHLTRHRILYVLRGTQGIFFFICPLFNMRAIHGLRACRLWRTKIKFNKASHLLFVPISDCMDIYILTPQKSVRLTRHRILYVLRGIQGIFFSYVPFFPGTARMASFIEIKDSIPPSLCSYIWMYVYLYPNSPKDSTPDAG